MADASSLESLQDLHRDLQALSESRLPVLDRLWLQLEARVDDFRNLLDQKRRDDGSRQKVVQDSSIVFDDGEYSVNDDFREQSIQLANTLDLDELESAQLLHTASKESNELDRPPFFGALIRYQQRRHFLLECLRLVIKISQEGQEDDELHDDVTQNLEIVKREIYNTRTGNAGNGVLFWKKCLAAMGEIEKRLQDLHDRYIKLSMMERSPSAEIEELIKLEKASLTRQHESLAGICCYMTKETSPGIDGFSVTQEAAKRLDKHDAILIHYVPILTLLISSLGPTEAKNISLREARTLHKSIVSTTESAGWGVRSFQATVIAYWLAEYSGRYVEASTESPLQGVDLSAEADERSKVFMDSIKDGALHFMLSICQGLRPDRWYDPARAGLVSLLLKDAATLPSDTVPFTEDFQVLVMEQLQGFVDAFISHMPDTLRKLKVEEDEQRRQLQSRFQRDHVEYELHLERFLIIICFAYDGSSDAAVAFWNEPEGNLYGFLQWAAKRQTTPRVAAFCEMLRAISVGEDCAEAAHRFLQEEAPQMTIRSRRSTSLSYSQIFTELQFYSSSVGDKNAGIQGVTQTAPLSATDQIVEPESAMMLESYLRLLAHLCSQSSVARDWVLQTANIVPMLLTLCQSHLESRLRASTFSALSSFLSHKTTAIAFHIWTYLDTWLHTGLNTHGKPGPQLKTPQEYVWHTIASGYEESNAFVELLRALIAPPSDDSGLRDSLPFPENLGSSHRMPGIDNYIDFVMGRIFAEKQDGLEPLQRRVMRWNCLNFISTCLGSFNEDLIVLANVAQASVDVDTAMQSSSLSTYMQLHPFARVMEWMFNDKVIQTLFETAHQDIHEVNDALPDSPLVLSLLSSIEVMNQIMSLQSTYLDLVRPLIKLNSTNRKVPVANAAIASFEDAVYTNLTLIVDLGLYCGTGHQDLTIASLRLLERLSASRKLNGPSDGVSNRSGRSKMIGVVEKDHDAERIARALVSEMQVDEREVMAGPESSGYIIKTTILNFLNGCLRVSPSRPCLAHLLLGFSTSENQLIISDEGLFARGDSLFHAIVQIATYYPDEEQDSFLSWLTGLKRSCFEVLQRLWRSPLSSSITMSELRANNFLYDILLRQHIITPDTQWEGASVDDETFYMSDSALAFQSYLTMRSTLYDYMGRELRWVSQENITSSKGKVQSAIMGTTILLNGESIRNSSILDLYDFMEVVANRPQIPEMQLMSMEGLNFEVCREPGNDYYNLASAAQLITLRRNTLKREGRLQSLEEEQALEEQGQMILSLLHGMNQQKSVAFSQKDLLRAWVQAITIILENGDFDDAGRTNFILQILQLITPKIDNAYQDDTNVAVELLRLSKTLLQHVNFTSPTFEDITSGGYANDRMFQLFKTALSGIYTAVAEPLLRETCYQICYRYQLNASRKHKQLRRYIIQAIEAAGDYYLEVICEDAYAGQGTCRVSALMFLESLVHLSIQERSKHILERLVRFNFISLCVDSIKTMPTDLHAAAAPDIPLLISSYSAILSLLLRIAQTSTGAAHVLNSGLFCAVRESGIFAADPDIGLEIDNPHALAKYFDLLLEVLRVINAVVLSRGPQNRGTIAQGREFLKENRNTMVSVFKRNAGVGGVRLDRNIDLDDLVDNFTLLITATGFLEHEEKESTQKSPIGYYS
ncbi:nuclear pore complex subunit [Pseudovirgaria hyperparasitica]|uniref:Nuclear pore complex subunit n=1 Tax=Pseudovirgaria hyperparasitica TaxID=470096 RepID=A0A6A6WKA7_9PEZI|nr:nuclear pore complex subunit [Pseudovirgaria hyperparasitica]KAF2762610.1 nuclear pore complex subunit [Pseudovirgaria hyperparasitica]